MALTKKLERIPGRGPHVDKDGWLPAWFIGILNDLLEIYYNNDEELETSVGTKQTQADVLDDLASLGAAANDGEFIVATGAGTFAYESGATARTSLGLGSMATLDASSAIYTPSNGS